MHFWWKQETSTWGLDVRVYSDVLYSRRAYAVYLCYKVYALCPCTSCTSCTRFICIFLQVLHTILCHTVQYTYNICIAISCTCSIKSDKRANQPVHKVQMKFRSEAPYAQVLFTSLTQAFWHASIAWKKMERQTFDAHGSQARRDDAVSPSTPFGI